MFYHSLTSVMKSAIVYQTQEIIPVFKTTFNLDRQKVNH